MFVDMTVIFDMLFGVIVSELRFWDSSLSILIADCYCRLKSFSSSEETDEISEEEISFYGLLNSGPTLLLARIFKRDMLSELEACLT
jgi:hypothetical protein